MPRSANKSQAMDGQMGGSNVPRQGTMQGMQSALPPQIGHHLNDEDHLATTPATAQARVQRNLHVTARRKDSGIFNDQQSDLTPGGASSRSRLAKRSVTASNVTIQKEKASDIRKR